MVLVRRPRSSQSPFARDDELAALVIMAADSMTLAAILELVRLQIGKVTSMTGLQRFLAAPSNPVLSSLETLSNSDPL